MSKSLYCFSVAWGITSVSHPLRGINGESVSMSWHPVVFFFVTVWENTVEWSVFCDAMAPTWYLVTDQTLTFTIFSAWSTHLETRIISSIIFYLYMVWQKCAVLHPLGPRIWDFNCNHTMSNTFRKKNICRKQTSVSLTLIYWGRVTHICVNKLIIIGSIQIMACHLVGAKPLSEPIVAGLLSIENLEAKLREILIVIRTFSFKKMQLKISSWKWRPFCLGLNKFT